MRLAIGGKGGSGKTTIAGTLARVLAARGHPVVTIDADLNPNLGLTLGVPREQFDAGVGLPTELLEHRDVGGSHVVVLTRPFEEVVSEFAIEAPGGIPLLTMGRPQHAGGGWMCAAHSTVRGVLAEVPADAGFVVVDLEASPEHLTRATVRHIDLMLLVAEPYFKSLETARRYHALANDLGIPRVAVVGNRMPAGEVDVVAEYCASHGFEHLGSVPFDAAFEQAERAGAAPIDHAAGSAGVQAVTELARRVEERARRERRQEQAP